MTPFRIYSITALVAVLVCAVAALTWVDLSPRVDNDFFFSTDDPQLQASQAIGKLFPSRDQLLISATAPEIAAAEYVARIEALTEDLEAVAGIASVQSLTRGPAAPNIDAVAESPIWSRLLLGENPRLTQLLAFVADPEDDEAAADSTALIRRVEEVLAEHHQPSFSLDISGVPYVVELVRRSLDRDLRVFSTAALAVFGLLIALIYRSLWIVVGALSTCLGACAVTLVLLAWAGSPIGLLTANIITIVFVLTLSHIVFLTANFRQIQGEAADPGKILGEALRRTFEASVWCMTTTLLGFGSLLFADAKPLRELGFAGAVGTVVALAVAFGIYPLFLRRTTRQVSEATSARRGAPWAERLLATGGAVTAVVAVAAVVAAPGMGRLDTDPNLLSYFADGSELRNGLERIDRNGGSSPMLLVVTDPAGEPLDTQESQERMASLQKALEEDPEVGTVISLSVLLAEARRAPLAFLLPASRLIDILSSPTYDNVAGGFVTEDRKQALYFLRMRESERGDPRSRVVARLQALPSEHGLETRLTGGLYPLQATLGALVADSIFRGLGGLLLLFVVIAAVVSRSPGSTGAMILSLLVVPVLLLGALGHLGAPVDIISSPAPNVAIALGIDSMIHLVTAVRRRRSAGETGREAWRGALERLGPAILGAALILAGGFGIFALSSFPPTVRFGLAVAAGTLIAGLTALAVLPFLDRRLHKG